MDEVQNVMVGAEELLGSQPVATSLLPLGERKATLAEVVHAAETLVAARRLLKGTGWARVVEKRGRRSVEVRPYIIPREHLLLREDVVERIQDAAGVLTWALNNYLPTVDVEIPNIDLGLKLTITFNE